MQDAPFLECSSISLDIDYSALDVCKIILDKNSVKYTEFGDAFITLVAYRPHEIRMEDTGIPDSSNKGRRLFDMCFPDSLNHVPLQLVRLVLPPETNTAEPARLLLIRNGSVAQVAVLM
jgi:hypothetical protein